MVVPPPRSAAATSSASRAKSADRMEGSSSTLCTGAIRPLPVSVSAPWNGAVLRRGDRPAGIASFSSARDGPGRDPARPAQDCLDRPPLLLVGEEDLSGPASLGP